MIIAGLQKLTLIDYPGKLAATVFLVGCNFRCPWCYSSELVIPEKIEKQPKISEREFFKFLRSKKGLLEGVVICGGEPTTNNDLPKFIKRIKKMGYLVKLDTNGSNPEMLRRLIDKNMIDYVAMDVKYPRERYPKRKEIEKSIEILKQGKINCECRTTVVPSVLDKKDILKIVQWISGVPKYYLQNFRPEKTIDPKFEKIKPYPQKYLLEIQRATSPFFEICQIR